MACLKCGKETEQQQAFCPECRQVMAQYPVKPGTPIQIRERVPKVPEKKGKTRAAQDPRRVVRLLKKINRALMLTVVALTLVIGALCCLLIHEWQAPEDVSNIGRNYTTDASLRPEG